MGWQTGRRAVLGGVVAFGLMAGIALTSPVATALAQEGEITDDPGGPYGGNGQGPTPGSDIFMCIYYGMECPPYYGADPPE